MHRPRLQRGTPDAPAQNMRALSIFILSTTLIGCVSQAKFDDLKRQYDEAQEKLAERQQRVGSLGASYEDAQAQVRRLQSENARSRVQVASLETERQQLEDEQHKLTMEMTKLLEDRSRLKASSEQLQAALNELAHRKAEADRRVAEFKALLTRFKGLIDAGALKVTISEGRMVLQLPTDVLFDSGSARLSRAGKETIAQVTTILKEVSGRHYQVEGHTDNVPIHNSLYASNWELAAARGLGVVRAMVEGGIDSSAVSAASYGEYHPVARNDIEEGRRVNRRIEIIVVPDLSMLPGYEELQKAMTSS
jgi:chemotaxis protein MotB